MTHAQKVRERGRYDAAASMAIASSGGAAYDRLKAVVEWVASLLLLIAVLPLLAVLACLLVCTSKGPIFYSQVRLGRYGRPFRLYKLRTMADGCEAETGPVWSVAGDPRATALGRVLRATHLDELPQLWNVLRGEMSLIGPRPERPEIAEEIERFLPDFRRRLAVRPGLTGLAQMLQPPDSDIHTVCVKLAHDLEYIRYRGPVLDLRIATATALSMAKVLTFISRWLVKPYAPARPMPAPTSAPALRLTEPMSMQPRVPTAAKAVSLTKAA